MPSSYHQRKLIPWPGEPGFVPAPAARFPRVGHLRRECDVYDARGVPVRLRWVSLLIEWMHRDFADPCECSICRDLRAEMAGGR